MWNLFSLKVLIAFSIFHVIYTKQSIESIFFCECPQKPTPPNHCVLIIYRRVNCYWCWIFFKQISSPLYYTPHESICVVSRLMEKLHTIFTDTSTHSTMHTQIQLTIIWLDVHPYKYKQFLPSFYNIRFLSPSLTYSLTHSLFHFPFTFAIQL